MRTLLAAPVVALVVALPAAADGPKSPIGEPRQRLLKGNYAEARAGFEKLLADAKFGPAAAAGIATAYRAEGEYEKALTTLTDALKKHPDNPDILAARGDLLFDLGRWDEADADAKAALKKSDTHFLARWVRARLLRDRGQDLKAADTEVRWFVRTYTARSNADDDIKNPDDLLLVGLAGAENARWNRLSKQFAFILNEVYKDAMKFDPDFWPVEMEAGNMLLEKYNRPDAIDAFDKVITINPNVADPHVGKALAALIKFEIKDADKHADEALKRNPRHPAALRVKADVAVIAGDFASAERHLKAARDVNPRDPITLGKLAAVYHVTKRPDQLAAVVKDAEGYDAKPGQFYFEYAEALDGRKQYAKAEELFRKAAALRPTLSGPQTHLGLLYLRMGKEKEGREILTKAFELDKFNVRVSNSLKVMTHLDKYATIETPHYSVKYDPKTDKVLAEMIAEYLEETHAMLKEQFKYEPPGKIPFEVFNTHEMFSGRTIGLPDLHTIGATTGQIVAMASPKAKGVVRPFNWGRVIRHELTHVFNLTQTDFQCPHWFTEGLAVRNEQMQRPVNWTQILRDKFDAKELFTLDTIMFGFVRPRGPDEWTLAYTQSQLYVEFLTATYGDQTVPKLLVAYKDGVDTGSAIKSACGVDVATFEKGYLKYVEQLLKPYRTAAGDKKRPDEKPMTFEELEKAHKENPDDVEIAARLADQYFRRRKMADARKTAEAVLAVKKGHPLASVVKARLLSISGDDEGARAILEEAVTTAPDDPRVLLPVGRYYLEAKEYEKAAAVFEKGRKNAPLDGDWNDQLVRLYTQTKDNDKLIAVLKEVVAHDPDELDGRLKLTKAALADGRLAEAEKYAWDAIRIDVTNDDARRQLFDVLKAAGKTELAEKMAKRFEGN